MATRGKAPASRTLNYSLSGDVMNRVKGSLDSGSTIQAINEGASGITDAVSEGSEELVNQRVQHENMKDSADLVFEAGMDQFGTRASWATGATYDKFLEIEEAQRIKYNDAIASGKKKLASKILREQKDRAGQQQTWKSVFETLNPEHPSHVQLLTDLDPEAKYIIGRLTSQEGKDFKIEYTEPNEKTKEKGGEMVMKFLKQNPKFNPNEDESETNRRLLPDKPENYTTMRGPELDKLIARNRAPKAEQEALAKRLGVLEDEKIKLKPFNYAANFTQNKDLINKENINSMMKGELGLHETGSFLKSANQHPDFTKVRDAGMKLKTGDMNIAADTDGDNVISDEEFMNLTDNDKDAVMALMQKPENFEIAQYYLAEFITLAQSRHMKGYNPRIPGTDGKTYNDIELENEISKQMKKNN
tara:strand:+ start:1183 stop:2433 length:1251 start_codon:yes stop_codon:yes gene_type:complete